jgi:hypothetical protein
MMKRLMSSLDIVPLINIKINRLLRNHCKNKWKISYKVIYNRIKSFNKARKISMNKIYKEE